MRITPNMMTQQFLYNITNDNNQMANLENQLSTGKTLNEPSDNPLAVSEDMSLTDTLSQTTAYQNTISQSQTWMNSTSAALSNLNTTLQQLQQLVIQASNGTNTDSAARSALVASATEFVSNVSQIADTQQGTRYLFGGTATSTPPSSYAFSSAISTLPGVSSNQTMQVANGVAMPINVTAVSLFQTAPPGAADLQQTMTSILADLQSGEQQNLSTDLANLNANMTQVTSIEANLGSRQTRMTAISNQMSQYATLVANQKGNLEDANMAQVITSFNTDQTVYQAALKLGAQILQPTLVSYLS